MKLCWLGLCLAVFLVGTPQAAAKPFEPPSECSLTPEGAGEELLQLARMDQSKCIIWCGIKRQNCAEDCAATADGKLKICKQGCQQTFQACTQRCG